MTDAGAASTPTSSARSSRRSGTGCARHQAVINRLNVYPVPDGDTGTNMALTLESVVGELERPATTPTWRRRCKAISHGSLMGARGNSRRDPLADPPRPRLDVERGRRPRRARRWPRALAAASDAAYGAVMKPVEGTILTVVREAAEGAGRGRRPDASSAVAEAAADAGRDRAGPHARACCRCSPRPAWSTRAAAGLPAAARRPAPRRRRPADARAARTCRRRSTSSVADRPRARARRRRTATSATSATRSCTSSRPTTRPSPPSSTCGPASATRSSWSAATASGTATSTPTTSAPASRPPSTAAGPATSGSPTCSSRSRRSGGSARAARRSCPTSGRAPSPCRTAVVAVSTGDGVRRIFHSLGVQRIVTGGQSMNPSTARAARGGRGRAGRRRRHPPEQQEHRPGGRAGRRPDGQAGAGRADPGRRRGLRRARWPTTPRRRATRTRREMRDAADNVVAGEVTRAVRDSSCDVGPIAEGDWLGHRPHGHPRGREGAVERHRRPARRAAHRGPRDRHAHRGRGRRRRPTPGGSPSGWPSTTPRSRARSTTAASRCTPTTSASSSADRPTLTPTSGSAPP